MYYTVAKCLTAETKTFSEKNHPSWFDWSFIVLYTSLNERRSLKMSLGLALSFEIISSSIRIVLTRIRPTVSIPNPKSNEFLRFRFTLKWYSKCVNRSSIDVLTVYKCPLPILLFSCGCVSWRYFIEWAEADDTVSETHTRVWPDRTTAAECRGLRSPAHVTSIDQSARNATCRFRHAVVWLMLYVLGVTIVRPTSI